MSYLLWQELARRNRPSITAPSSTFSEHRTSLAAPDAEIVIVALRHAQRISCVLISDDRIARRLIPNRTAAPILAPPSWRLAVAGEVA
jgi:hypothetical protein